jgi:5'-nucleotidase
MSSGDDSRRPNPLPSALVSNLQSVLAARRPPPTEDATATAAETSAPAPAPAPAADDGPAKPVVLLTCAAGIQSPGLAALVDALVKGGRCDVHVCAPESYAPQSQLTPSSLIRHCNFALDLVTILIIPVVLMSN